MTDLETRFTRAAEAISPGPAPLEGVRRRAGRIRSRRRAAGAVAAVAAVALVLGATQLARVDTRAGDPAGTVLDCPTGVFLMGGGSVAVGSDCTASLLDSPGDVDSALSPDDTTGAYLTLTDTGATLRVVDLASGISRQVASLDDGQLTDPVFSPDSDRLAYVAESLSVVGGGTSVHVVDLATGEDRTVVQERVGSLAWSPDGLELAYVAYGTDSSSIGVLDLGTTIEHPLPSGNGEGGPTRVVWSPDGTQLATIDDSGLVREELRVLDVDGTVLHRRPLTSTPQSRSDTMLWTTRGISLVDHATGSEQVRTTTYDPTLASQRVRTQTVPDPNAAPVGRPADQDDLQGSWTLGFAGAEPAHGRPVAAFSTPLVLSGHHATFRECRDPAFFTVASGDFSLDSTSCDASPVSDLLAQVRHAYVDGDRVLLTSVDDRTLLTLTRH